MRVITEIELQPATEINSEADRARICVPCHTSDTPVMPRPLLEACKAFNAGGHTHRETKEVSHSHDIESMTCFSCCNVWDQGVLNITEIALQAGTQHRGRRESALPMSPEAARAPVVLPPEEPNLPKIRVVVRKRPLNRKVHCF